MMRAYDGMTTTAAEAYGFLAGGRKGAAHSAACCASRAAVEALGLRFRFGSPISRPIPQADFSRLLFKVPLRWRSALRLH